jgi:hypothetical protein
MYVLPLHSPPGHVPAASLAVLTVESSRFRYQFPVPCLSSTTKTAHYRASGWLQLVHAWQPDKIVTIAIGLGPVNRAVRVSAMVPVNGTIAGSIKRSYTSIHTVLILFFFLITTCKLLRVNRVASVVIIFFFHMRGVVIIFIACLDS